jgi:hypothetical protein
VLLGKVLCRDRHRQLDVRICRGIQGLSVYSVLQNDREN